MRPSRIPLRSYVTIFCINFKHFNTFLQSKITVKEQASCSFGLFKFCDFFYGLFPFTMTQLLSISQIFKTFVLSDFFFYLTQFNRHKLWCPAKRARQISLYLGVVLSPLIHIPFFKKRVGNWDEKTFAKTCGTVTKERGENWSIGNLSNNDGVSNENRRQKSNRSRLAKQQLCTCITLFCTFVSLRRTTTT